MTEDSIFSVNVEQYLLVPDEKTPPNTFIMFIVHVRKFLKRRKQGDFTANT